MGNSKIEYVTKSWNPVTGCTPVSEGCKNCYAKAMFERFRPNESFSKVVIHPERFDEPLHWQKSQSVFLCSMSDIFHPDIPDEVISKIFAIMQVLIRHVFLVLTKRPERMYNLLDKGWKGRNIFLGVTCENQKAADERIPLLLQTPAAVRWVSYEPALGAVDFTALNFGTSWEQSALDGWYVTPGNDGDIEPEQHSNGNKLDWVVMACESGKGARPMDIQWARSVRDQCKAANVPLFYKQAVIDGKLVKMPELDGVVYDQYPK